MFEQNLKLAYKYTWRVLRKRPDLTPYADELRHELLISLHDACRRFRPELGRLSTLFYRTARYTVINFRYSRMRERASVSVPVGVIKEAIRMSRGESGSLRDDEMKAATSALWGPGPVDVTSAMLPERTPSDPSGPRESERFVALLAALDRLPARRRLAVLYRHGLDRPDGKQRSFSAVARRMKISRQGAFELYKKGIKQLAEALRDAGI